MSRTLVKLICYIEVEHGKSLDPRTVNTVVREELGEDFKTILSGIKFKKSFTQAVSDRLNDECLFSLISEPTLLTRLNS
jgi:hypothetical protein